MPAVTDPVTIRIDEARKRLRASGPLGLRETATLVVSPSAPAAGTCTLTLTRLGTVIAEATLTSGAGSIDLSTAEAVALFTGMPARARINLDAHLWSAAEDRLLAVGQMALLNNPEAARSTLRMAAAGELTMTLAGALDAGEPVKRDADGEAAGVQAGEGHLFLGITAAGGLAGASVRVVTAGIVAVADWGLSPGNCYYLSHGSVGLTATPPAGYNERPVGIALDANTLALVPQPVVQSLADSDDIHTLKWDTATRRFMAVAATATSAGVASAGLIPYLGADGKLSSTMLPEYLLQWHALFDGVADLPADPTVSELVAKLAEILAILKGG